MIEYTVEVYPDGSKFWYLNDKLHREDGPAAEGSDGFTRYYLNGKRLTKEEWEERLKNPCSDKIVEIDGIPYKLVRV